MEQNGVFEEDVTSTTGEAWASANLIHIRSSSLKHCPIYVGLVF